MKLFNDLGDEIEKLWNKQNYDEGVFPRIAADALRRAGLPKKTSAWEVVEWALARQMLPEQRDLRGNFGDPPITVFNAPRFYIDVYFWFEGTTAIHEHAFAGAFQVFSGSSIHSWYDFEPRVKINSLTQIGDMSLKACEILNVGDVHEIRPGRNYIHSLFHLDQPSVSIVVRTFKIDGFLPQFSYFKPNLAVDPFYENPQNIKKLQCVTALLRAKSGDADRLISDLLERSDFQTTFEILRQLRSHLGPDEVKSMFGVADSPARFDRFLAAARTRHGELMDAVEDALAYHTRTTDLVRRRGYVTDPELRFFLALLMNVEGRERILDLVGQRFPEMDPSGKVLDWVYDLSNIRLAGSNSQNALGIPSFDASDLFVFEKLLSGGGPEMIEESVKSEYAAEAAAAMLETLESRITKISGASVFRPILAGAPNAKRAA